jgi:hypothetical protein
MVLNFTPEKILLLKSIAWQAMATIAHNLVHKICGEHKDNQTANGGN